MIVAGTGHRFITLPEQKVVAGIAAELCLLGVRQVISGMAIGWDMALAEAALSIGVPFVAAVPFPAQPDRWPQDQQDRWARLIGQAEDVVYISPYTTVSAYERRNRWMIDRADLVFAYWDGSLTGGTSNGVRYAQKKRVALVNLWGQI